MTDDAFSSRILYYAQRKGLMLATSVGSIEEAHRTLERQAEVEILPLAESEGLAVTPYSPLGSGLLTGKYTGGHQPETGRLVQNQMHRARYSDASYHEVAERFVSHARAKGVDPATLGVAWVMTNPAVTAPIIGARSVEQLEASLAAVSLALTPEWRTEVSELSPEPPLPEPSSRGSRTGRPRKASGRRRRGAGRSGR